MRPTKSRSWFTRLTKTTAHASGQPFTFIAAACVIVAWAALGPVFDFSDSWQLVINTATTVVTFLMVFPDSEHAEPRLGGHAGEAGRDHPRRARIPKSVVIVV